MTKLSTILDEQDERDLHGHAHLTGRVNHLGMSGRTIAEVFAAVRELPHPAVRSGHIGNWKEIWQGQVGLVDYNRYICRDFGMGRPLLHAHTFTETLALDDGDTIYLPGGRIRERRYDRLPLYVKIGDDFRPVRDDESVCCAFAYVEEGGQLTPLVRARADEIEAIPGATTIPTLLTGDKAFLRQVLGALVDIALDGSSGLCLDDLFGSSVSRQGIRGRAPVPTPDGIAVETTTYAGRGELVEAAIEALKFGSLTVDAEEVFRASQAVGEYLPLLGATAVLALVAAWDVHLGSADDGIHAHWGAISMSGYPPVSGGYFGRRATRKSMRQLAQGLATLPELSVPIRFALLPAPVLSLLPPAEFAQDCELIDKLLTAVLQRTELPASDPSSALDQIAEVVGSWLASQHHELSAYYLRRFGVARSVLNGTVELPEDGRPAELERFGDLTMQQASMVLGALMEQAKAICGNDD